MESKHNKDQDYVFLQKLKNSVLNHLDQENLSVEDFAMLNGMSRSQLHRKLRKLTAKSTSHFIRDIRLEEAHKMLEHNEGSASEIAYRTGFNSPSYFHKCFHQRFGYTPGDVRHQQHAVQTEDLSSGLVQDPFSAPYTTLPKAKRPISGFILTKNRLIIFALLMFSGLLMTLLFYKGTQQEPGLTAEHSIAVLPFVNLSTQGDNPYFTEGLMEDLRYRLGSIKSFQVTSRTSAEMYGENTRNQLSTPDIARQLNVNYLVEGSVQRNGEDLRINVQLLDARKDRLIWSERFDRKIDNVFQAQSEIAMNIATALNTFLSAKEQQDIKKHHTVNTKAMERYQLGIIALKKGTGEGYITAINHFEAALEADSTYALAAAGLAQLYYLMGVQNHLEIDKARTMAMNLSQQALRLDPELSEGYTVKGCIFAFIDKDWPKALEAFNNAIKYNPNCPTAYQYYAGLLALQDKTTEARKFMDKALKLDPLSFILRFQSASLYLNEGLLSEAKAENERAKEIVSDHPWSMWMDMEISYYGQDYEETLQKLIELGALNGIFKNTDPELLFKKEGINAVLSYWIAHSDSPLEKARLSSMIGKVDQAVGYLQNASQSGYLSPEISREFCFQNLRKSTEFQQLLFPDSSVAL